jgi:hypothetical protein
MKRVVEKYASLLPHERDYTALLHDTNIFTAGKDLIWDKDSCRQLRIMLAEAEARLDLEAAWRCLHSEPACSDGSLWSLSDSNTMKVSYELEYWAFFEPHDFEHVLYIGCGAYPQIALYALAQKAQLHIDGVDIVPHCTVLCSQIAARLGLSKRLSSTTADGRELDPAVIKRYDGFFISSAVRPKNQIIERLLQHKCPGALIYAREDEAHPFFYEPVAIEHPDVISARIARAQWQSVKGEPFPLPAGCEVV